MSSLPKPFKKLHQNIKESLEHFEITTPTTFQSNSIPEIKSGANVFCIAPKDSGKTTTLITTTLQKLKCEEVGTSVRAVVLVEDTERALELYDLFLKYTRYNSLRVYVSHDHLHIDTQKSELFEGFDILIATTTRMNKLLLSYGVSTSQIKILSVDDAEFLTKPTPYKDILSITESLKKCQYVLYSENMHPKLKGLSSYFMEYAKTVSI